MKLCYVVLVHHKFEQAARMVRRLSAPGVNVVVHIDAKVDAHGVARLQALLAAVPDVSYAERVDAAWGTYRQALAILRGMRGALDSGVAFDRCVLLSGQDYPIASHAEAVAFFEADRTAEYMEATPLDVADGARPGWTPYYRFRRHHVWVAGRRCVMPLWHKPMPSIPLYHGSTWWALTRGAVQHVVATFEADAPLRRYWSTGFLVDEVVVPSLLMASPYAARVTRDNVTYTEFTPTSGPHPRLLRQPDLPALLATWKLYARKFDAAVDADILDSLDAVHGHGQDQTHGVTAHGMTAHGALSAATPVGRGR